jgi:hypothetical protein
MIGTCNSAGNGIDIAWPYSSWALTVSPSKVLTTLLSSTQTTCPHFSASTTRLQRLFQGLPTKCFCGTPLPKPTPSLQCLLEVVQLFLTTPFPPKSLLKTVAIPLIHVLFTLMELSPRSPNIDLLTD